MPRTTSRSDPQAATWGYHEAQSLDRELEAAVDHFKKLDMGAGQKATMVNGLRIVQQQARLGIALYPDEPISQTIAALGQQVLLYEYLLALYQPEDHPFAEQRIEQLGDDRQAALEYMLELVPREIPGVYTQAKDPDHLERLLEAPTTTTGRIDYAALKERIDIVDYIGRTVQLRKTGTRYKGLCPFHGEKTPSFVVYPNTRSWYCFGCNDGGDVIHFAKRMEQPMPQVA